MKATILAKEQNKNKTAIKKFTNCVQIGHYTSQCVQQKSQKIKTLALQ